MDNESKLAKIIEACRVMNSLHGREEVLDKILSLVEDVFSLKRCAILTLEEDRDTMTIRKARGYKQEVVDRIKIVRGEGITGHVFQNGKPMFVNDVKKDRRYIPGVEGAISEMAAPLKLNGEVIGVIDAESHIPFNNEMMEFFSIFAAQAAIALSNANLFERLNKKIREQESLNRISCKMTLNLREDDLLEEILKLAHQCLCFERCAILLKDQDEKLFIKAHYGYSPAKVKNLKIAVGQGISGRTVSRGEPTLIEDVNRDKDYISASDGGGCEMAVPIAIEQKVIGVLDAEHSRPFAFNAEDLQLFATFGYQVSHAIRNARTYARIEYHAGQLEDKIEQMKMLYAVGDRLGISFDIEVTLQDILDLSSTALNLDACAIMFLDHEEQLVVKASRGYPPELKDQVKIKLGQGITGKVAESGQPLLVNDVTKCSYYIRGTIGGRSEMTVPLKARGKVIGVIDAESPRANAFDQDTMEVFSIFAMQAAIAIDNARLLVKTNRVYVETIKSLAQALEARDSYTKGHSERVTHYSLHIADEMGLSREKRELINQAGLLHDIGKIGISDMVLHKREKLSEADMKIIKTHPNQGDYILGHIKFLDSIVASILHHHERYDGFGYPAGLQGEDIPLIARILSVADAFDAMTTDRPYRDAISLEKAKKELLDNRGSQFDPKVVNIFISLIDELGVEKMLADL